MASRTVAARRGALKFIRPHPGSHAWGWNVPITCSLWAEGALRFALRMGFKKEDLLTDESRKKWLEWKAKLPSIGICFTGPVEDWGGYIRGAVNPGATPGRGEPPRTRPAACRAGANSLSAARDAPARRAVA